MELARCIDMVRGGLKYLPPSMSNNLPQVLVAMLAIGLQESRFIHRYQVLNTPGVKGPARGFWQFESGGGVRGVMTHAATKPHLQKACRDLKVPFDRQTIWQALENNDDLAVVCARLLLYSDPKALPPLRDVEGMWQYYLRNWRPGAYFNGSATAQKSLRSKWGTNYSTALKEVNK